MSLNDGIRELVDELANAVRHLYRIPVPICDIDHVVETIGADCSHPLRSGVPGGAVRPSQRGICCHPQAAGPPCGSLRAVCLPVEVHEGGFPGTLILQWNPTAPFLPAQRLADGSPSWRLFVAATVYRWWLKGTILKAFQLLTKSDWLLGYFQAAFLIPILEGIRLSRDCSLSISF